MRCIYIALIYVEKQHVGMGHKMSPNTVIGIKLRTLQWLTPIVNNYIYIYIYTYVSHQYFHVLH